MRKDHVIRTQTQLDGVLALLQASRRAAQLDTAPPNAFAACRKAPLDRANNRALAQGLRLLEMLTYFFGVQCENALRSERERRACKHLMRR